VTDGASGLIIVDISNPSAPTQVGLCDTPGTAQNVAVSGNYAYVADSTYGLRIINIANPTAPVEAGFIDTPGNAFDVGISGSYAYITDGTYGLQTINISNPSAPIETSSYDTGYAHGMDISGMYAYIADDAFGLRILNISNPSAPIEVSLTDTPGDAYDVAVSGNYAYIADGDGGFRIIDISNPNAPFLMGSPSLPGFVYWVSVSGTYAFYQSSGFDFRIIDVSNPGVPVQAGFYDVPGGVSKSFAKVPYIYTNAGEGLIILRYGMKTHLPLILKDYHTYFEGPWEQEENNSPAQANGPIRSGVQYSGYPNDDNDYFYFTTGANGTITVNLTGHTGAGVQLLLYYQLTNDLKVIDNSAPYEITYNGAPGNYYVRIYTASSFNNTSPYTLWVTYP
jgi:hypothetical protein